jgi:ribosomal protein S18 acetylase RimI-like enzyme
MLRRDVNEVVHVHLAAFPGFFLSFLGPRFLRQLYLAAVTDPSGVCHVYCEDDHVLAFVVGTVEPAGFYRRLLRQRWWRFALASVGAVVRQPKICLRLFRALRRPQEVPVNHDCALLMSIAVSPGLQGKGAGRRLVMRFLDEAKERRMGRVRLETDTHNNDSANAFYQRLGFVLVGSYSSPEGRSMNEYEIAL